MKKIILTALVAVSAVCANAQVWMGGSLGFNVTSPKVGDSNTTFSIEPTVGYSLDDKWDIALSLGYANMGDVAVGSVESVFAINPFARYTFAKSGIASFFVDGGFGFGVANINGADNTNTFNIGLRPGVKVELSHKVELDAKLGWFGYENVKDAYSNFGLSVNNETLSFGMTWKF